MAGCEEIKGECGTTRATCKKTIKNRLWFVQDAHTRDLNKDPIETYAEALSRLYSSLEDTISKMDTALSGAIDYPSELSTGNEVDIRIFLKEADILLKSYFELFIKFSDR